MGVITSMNSDTKDAPEIDTFEHAPDPSHGGPLLDERGPSSEGTCAIRARPCSYAGPYSASRDFTTAFLGGTIIFDQIAQDISPKLVAQLETPQIA